ncbi:MAG: hypothetical protein CL678_10255 [Bdellovibrionaceae bacterium]|nr:hypothetical protein [Pseudobdellovibrionaceae bacterium]|tara:strand:- start:2964 stop:3449 length:486 start_codon:yes stop_codon:yes gene_type:complete
MKKDKITKTPWIQTVINRYGETVYNLCHRILLNEGEAQILTRDIFKTIEKSPTQNRYHQFEKQWILKVAFQKLKQSHQQHIDLSLKEVRELNETHLSKEERLENILKYMRNLPIESQFILLLKDQLNESYDEISTITGIPIESLKVKRQQVLQTLEEWIWQ